MTHFLRRRRKTFGVKNIITGARRPGRFPAGQGPAAELGERSIGNLWQL